MPSVRTIIDGAIEYHHRGYFVTPTIGKRPVSDDWQNSRLDEDEIRATFGGCHNVGVILGASRLADLDFDDAVAVTAYRIIDPRELHGAAVFHHADRPHLIVKAAGVSTRRFKRADGTVLLELRGEGAQTVFPPSVHADGLPYQWTHDREPCEVDPSRLLTIALMVATAAYASEFWTGGSRHDLALALAGFLARRIDAADVSVVIKAAALTAGDEEAIDRVRAAETTVERLRRGEPVSGLPTLDTLAPDLARALATWWGAIVCPDHGEERTEPEQAKRSHADMLVEIGRAGELFHDSTAVAFARMPVRERREVWPLRAKRYQHWLRREFFVRTGKAVGAEAVNAACGVLEGLAIYDGRTERLDNRVGIHEGVVYYDLADAEWRTVQIDVNGWSLRREAPVLFRRYNHQLPQVEPVHGGDVRAVLPFVNIQRDDELLLLVWLVSAFVPDIPHPIPDFHGEKGAGKTVGQRVLRRLIDPSTVESLSFPADIKELVQQLAHHYAPVYDNVDSLPPWLSDVLCRAVTGEGFTKRELFSDDDDIIYAYRRVVMLNGINVVPRRPDLLDRSILLRLDRIGKRARRAEKEFWAAFAVERPHILGGIFDTLSAALRIYPEVQLEALERMADFTRFGAAVARALGYSEREFLAAYTANIGAQTVEAVEGNPVGAAILELMKSRSEWCGTPTELLQALEDAGEAARLFRRSGSGKVDAKGWPGAPNILTRRLNEIRSNLSDLGFEIVQGHGDDRTIRIGRHLAEDGESTVGIVGSVGEIDPFDAEPDGTDATDAEMATFRGAEWEVKIR
jgi:Bifunctional DNA primase/polymerase, N-terminal